MIEIDGDSHFSERAERYDAARTEALVEHRLRVVRFTNSEVMENFEGVCQRIAEALES